MELVDMPTDQTGAAFAEVLKRLNATNLKAQVLASDTFSRNSPFRRWSHSQLGLGRGGAQLMQQDTWKGVQLDIECIYLR